MTSHEFRGVLYARPFRPFSFSTVDGETYPVSAPERAWHPPGGEIVAVSGPDGVALLDIEQIAEITFTPDPPVCSAEPSASGG